VGSFDRSKRNDANKTLSRDILSGIRCSIVSPLNMCFELCCVQFRIVDVTTGAWAPCYEKQSLKILQPLSASLAENRSQLGTIQLCMRTQGSQLSFRKCISYEFTRKPLHRLSNHSTIMPLRMLIETWGPNTVCSARALSSLLALAITFQSGYCQCCLNICMETQYLHFGSFTLSSIYLRFFSESSSDQDYVLYSSRMTSE
jgi:hypothetical protein